MSGGSGGSSSSFSFLAFRVVSKMSPAIPAAATTVSRVLVGDEEIAVLKASVWDFQDVTSQWTNFALLIRISIALFKIFSF